jgi:D-3-phosphoglycerate dehydrogenase
LPIVLRDGEDKMKVVIAHNIGITNHAIDMLRKVARVVILRDNSQETLLAEIREADSVILGFKPFVDRQVIEAAVCLKHIGRLGVGVDTVDLNAATERGIMVTNVPDVTTDTVAEFTVTLLLSLARNIPRCDRVVRDGRWEEERADLIQNNTEMFGKTHGLIGMGNIGSRVAIRCKAFGMTVLYYKRNRNLELEKTLGVAYRPFEDLLKESDSISLHTPLTEQTRDLLGRPQFEMMKRRVLLVNQSRGKVINEEALLAALREGLIGGYATDVYESEPPNPSGELFRFNNVVVTPHLGGMTRESTMRSSNMVAEDTIRGLRGETPKNLVNRSVLERKLT